MKIKNLALLFVVIVTCGILINLNFGVEPEVVYVEVVKTVYVPAPPEPKAPPAPKVPIFNIPLSEELQRYTYDLCIEYKIVDHYPLILAVMGHESRYNETVISKTNDYGLMQINRGNHSWLSDKLGITNFLSAKQNIRAGIYMLSTYLNKYSTVNEALMAYNMGEGGARKQWNAGNYTTTYTTKVHSVLKLILEDNYK